MPLALHRSRLNFPPLSGQAAVCGSSGIRVLNKNIGAVNTGGGTYGDLNAVLAGTGGNHGNVVIEHLDDPAIKGLDLYWYYAATDFGTYSSITLPTVQVYGRIPRFPQPAHLADAAQSINSGFSNPDLYDADVPNLEEDAGPGFWTTIPGDPAANASWSVSSITPINNPVSGSVCPIIYGGWTHWLIPFNTTTIRPFTIRGFDKIAGLVTTAGSVTWSGVGSSHDFVSMLLGVFHQ